MPLDAPQPACRGNSMPFDLLIDLTAGPAFNAARREARALCGVRDDGMFRAPDDRCPLAATCLMRDNAEEPWARAVLGLPASTRIADANAAKSAAARKKWDDKRAARLADLRELISLGVTEVETVAKRLDVSYAGLEKWCRLYARDEWKQLDHGHDPRHGNQYRRTQLGTISTRRRKAA